MSISIATMGKFNGPPPRKASSKYGGGTSAAAPPPQKHKFPTVMVSKVNTEKEDINIVVNDIKEIEDD